MHTVLPGLSHWQRYASIARSRDDKNLTMSPSVRSDRFRAKACNIQSGDQFCCNVVNDARNRNGGYRVQQITRVLIDHGV